MITTALLIHRKLKQRKKRIKYLEEQLLNSELTMVEREKLKAQIEYEEKEYQKDIQEKDQHDKEVEEIANGIPILEKANTEEPQKTPDEIEEENLSKEREIFKQKIKPYKAGSLELSPEQRALIDPIRVTPEGTHNDVTKYSDNETLSLLIWFASIYQYNSYNQTAAIINEIRDNYNEIKQLRLDVINLGIGASQSINDTSEALEGKIEESAKLLREAEEFVNKARALGQQYGKCLLAKARRGKDIAKKVIMANLIFIVCFILGWATNKYVV